MERAMIGLRSMDRRRCPVCASGTPGRVIAESNVNAAELGPYAFASRKPPELMRHRLVECPVCDLVYADPAPGPRFLAEAYRAAAFDSEDEAAYAAATYAGLVKRLLPRLPPTGGALDIGTGDGAFMVELDRMGFRGVEGVEPSDAPRQAAPPGVRERIYPGVFSADNHEPASLRLITCLQTIEHVPNPVALCRDAVRLLVPGGALLLVGHDRRALVNRALGLRSPLLDIEHLQLFSPLSMRRLLGESGLGGVQGHHIVNRYPLRYWMRLAPLPTARLERLRLARLPFPMRVGNQAAWGFSARR